MMNFQLNAVHNIVVGCILLLSTSIPVARSQVAQPPLPGYSVYAEILNTCDYDAEVAVSYYTYGDYSHYAYSSFSLSSYGGYYDVTLCDGTLYDCTSQMGFQIFPWSTNLTYSFPFSSSPEQLYFVSVRLSCFLFVSYVSHWQGY